MDWVQVITIILSLAGFTGWIFNKLDNDIRGVSDRLDGYVKHSTAMFSEQSKRTDRLYQMFIDLLKERK